MILWGAFAAIALILLPGGKRTIAAPGAIFLGTIPWSPLPFIHAMLVARCAGVFHRDEYADGGHALSISQILSILAWTVPKFIAGRYCDSMVLPALVDRIPHPSMTGKGRFLSRSRPHVPRETPVRHDDMPRG